VTVILGIVLVLSAVALYPSGGAYFVVQLTIGAGCALLGLVIRGAERRLRRRATLVAFVLAAALLITPFVAHVYHNRSDITILVVIPDGQRGLVVLEIDPRQGEAVPLENDCYRFRVPPGGKLTIKSGEPFFVPRRWVFQYASGEVIPQAEVYEKPKSGAHIYSLGSVTKSGAGVMEQSIRFFLGTWDEFNEYEKRE
jgi:hypothetical protein